MALQNDALTAAIAFVSRGLGVVVRMSVVYNGLQATLTLLVEGASERSSVDLRFFSLKCKPRLKFMTIPFSDL